MICIVCAYWVNKFTFPNYVGCSGCGESAGLGRQLDVCESEGEKEEVRMTGTEGKKKRRMEVKSKRKRERDR